MLQGLLFASYECLRCHTPARLHKFYRLCYQCFQLCRADPKEGKLWFYGNRDSDDDRPTKLKPGSDAKIRLMRKRHLAGLALHFDGDEREVDWSLTNIQELYSEPIQREAGATGVERDGTRWRARPMAGGVKHNLGEFATEKEAVKKVRKFWIDWLGLPAGATKKEIEEARREDALGARSKARERKLRERKERAKLEVTPLFG